MATPSDSLLTKEEAQLSYIVPLAGGAALSSAPEIPRPLFPYLLYMATDFFSPRWRAGFLSN